MQQTVSTELQISNSYQRCAPGGHDVVVVYDFNEGLNFASLLDLALRHVLDDLSGVSIDAGNCMEKVA